MLLEKSAGTYKSLTLCPASEGPADTERHKLTGGQRLPDNSGVFVWEICLGRAGVRIHGARDDRALRHRAGRSLPPALDPPPQRLLTGHPQDSP
jgi:hypothetical protein